MVPSFVVKLNCACTVGASTTTKPNKADNLLFMFVK